MVKTLRSAGGESAAASQTQRAQTQSGARLSRSERDVLARLEAVEAFASGRAFELCALRLACKAARATDRDVRDALALAACAFIYSGNA